VRDTGGARYQFAVTPVREPKDPVMNDAACWARVVQARTQRVDLLPQRVWTLHAPGLRAELVWLHD
jgi:hypothetical protein